MLELYLSSVVEYSVKPLIHFFEKLIAGEPEVLARCERLPDGCYFDAKDLKFELRSLYELVGVSAGLDYPTFRRGLYQGGINSELSRLGIRVDIFSSSGSLDTSIYQLIRIA